MVQLTEEQARLLREHLGANWADFVSTAESSGFNEDDCDAIYHAVGGED